MKNFDYNAAVAELEKIELRVQDPSTPLEETVKLLERSRTVVEECRNYLRSVRESLEETT